LHQPFTSGKKPDGIETALWRASNGTSVGNEAQEPVMQIRRGILLGLLAVGLTATPADAQWVATPLLGVNLAGDVEEGKGGIGGSVGYFGGRLGFELDVTSLAFLQGSGPRYRSQ
jgi:hypothetical protein